MKGANILRIVMLILIISFLGIYLMGNSEFYDYEAASRSRLTKEQIKQFEQDIEEGKAIDVEDYLKLNEKNYDNLISRTTLNISQTISKSFDKALRFFFQQLSHAMND